MRTWVPSTQKMWQNPVKTCLEFHPPVLQVESLERTEMLLHICSVLTHFHSIYHSLSGTLVRPMATIYIPNISWKALEGCLANIYFFLLWLVVEPLQVLVGVKGWGVGGWSALVEQRYVSLDFKSPSLQFHRYLFMWISISNCFCWCFVGLFSFLVEGKCEVIDIWERKSGFGCGATFHCLDTK